MTQHAGGGWFLTNLKGSMVAAIVAMIVTLLASCLPSATVTCDDGTICSADTSCRIVGPDTLCVSPQQEKDCAEKVEGDVCGENTGMANRCRGGLCLPSPCGDAVIDPSRGEVCEADDVSQLQTCKQRGYQDGAVGCSASCGGADTEPCSRYCGDGVVDDDEECDGVAFADGLPSKCSDFAQAPLLGTVTCSSQCRIDSGSCYLEGWREEAIITAPAISVTSFARVITAVDTNHVWAVFGDENRVRSDAVAWWNGDRWQRATINDQYFYTSKCSALWATLDRAWVGCDDGAVVKFDELGDGMAAQLAATAQPVKALWGRNASDIWAGSGADIYHYDGAAWQPAETPVRGAAIIAIGGDADDVFALTTVGLSKRQSGNWVTVVSGAFNFLSVVNDRQIWLATYTNAKFYNGSVLSSSTTLLSPVVSIAALSADVLYYSVGREVGVEDAVRRLQLNSLSPAVDTLELKADQNIGPVAVSPSGSVWTMLGSRRVATRIQQLDAMAINATPLVQAPKVLITVGHDGIVFFTDQPAQPGSSNLYSYDRATVGAAGQLRTNVPGLILDLAAVAAPTGEQLLIQTANQLSVFQSSTNTVSTAPIAPNAIWSDGTAAFVTSTQGLHRFVNATSWPLLPVTLLTNAGPHLLTGGRVNQDFTLWLVPRRLAFADVKANKIQRIEINSMLQVVSNDIVVPSAPVSIDVSAVWSSGPDLWIAGQREDLDNPGSAYLARWTNGRWLEFSPPVGFGNYQISRLSHVWSNRPGQVWVLGRVGMNASQLLRFDGSRWFLASDDVTQGLTTLSRNAGDQLWANLLFESQRANTLARVDNTIQNLTGGRCPAQQELICIENGHSSTAPERNITTIVGGRFAASHYVLNSPILGTLRFTAALPAGVEAVWGLANTAGTCSPGVPLAYVAPASTAAIPNPVPQAEVTLGRARYFLTLRTVDPLDTTEYPVSIDYSCNRTD
jgi:hypothetical protein